MLARPVNVDVDMDVKRIEGSAIWFKLSGLAAPLLFVLGRLSPSLIRIVCRRFFRPSDSVVPTSTTAMDAAPRRRLVRFCN